MQNWIINKPSKQQSWGGYLDDDIAFESNQEAFTSKWTTYQYKNSASGMIKDLSLTIYETKHITLKMTIYKDKLEKFPHKKSNNAADSDYKTLIWETEESIWPNTIQKYITSNPIVELKDIVSLLKQAHSSCRFTNEMLASIKLALQALAPEINKELNEITIPTLSILAHKALAESNHEELSAFALPKDISKAVFPATFK